MRQLLQFILLKPVLWAASKFASQPDPERIFKALSDLQDAILEAPGLKGPLIETEISNDNFIVFSDQHRGAKNRADDFMDAEPNYLRALEYYNEQGFILISLGDAEELWENSLSAVKKHNTLTFEAEKLFIERDAYFKVFGNHDLFWANDPFAAWQLKRIYGRDIKIYEGVILKMKTENKPFRFFLTHGHQGDRASDGNWFSKFFVANIWAPLQAYLRINPNTPAYDEAVKTKHNRIMYEWSATQKNGCLITGHTHQPVFASLTHYERLQRELDMARQNQAMEKIKSIEEKIRNREQVHDSSTFGVSKTLPGYFNSGCCCFSDGDITGIEIARGAISLVKWETEKGKSVRKLLETKPVSELQQQLT
ncbi:MAG: metallophosphoesterase [Terrimonas sp.]|nr:metallophosphoesterase [Terrimonas sp.]